MRFLTHNCSDCTKRMIAVLLPPIIHSAPSHILHNQTYSAMYLFVMRSVMRLLVYGVLVPDVMLIMMNDTLGLTGWPCLKALLMALSKIKLTNVSSKPTTISSMLT